MSDEQQATTVWRGVASPSVGTCTSARNRLRRPACGAPDHQRPKESTVSLAFTRWPVGGLRLLGGRPPVGQE
eukprot:10603500-Alexandrium_andersonii.AAC.1